MGIPGYFAQAIKNVPRSIKTNVPNVARLFLDFNSAVHRGVTEKATEDSIINQACETLLEIVDTVSPSELIFVAIDGVAPLAKVNQQRSRRYLSQKMKAFTKSIGAADYTSKENREIFDRNAITPGTEFMTKLCNRLQFETESIAVSRGIKAIFSGSSIFGEGEHKILEYIRRNYVDGDTGINCIYGLDADLIILSMVLVDQIGSAPCIIREKNSNEDFENTEYGNYEYLDVMELIDHISQSVNKNLSKRHKILNHVIASFLVGNDFLPPLSYLNIKHGGLEEILEMCETPLCSETGYVIQWDSICEVLNKLANKEDTEFMKRDERYWNTKSQVTTNPVVIWDNYPIVNKNYKMKHISPGKPGWVPRYYEHLFYTNDVSKIVKDYIVGLQWTLDYYTGKYCKQTPCWQYVHAYSPTAIDVYNYVVANQENIDTIVGDELKTLRIYGYDPEVALLMVTPPSSFGILSPKLRSFATDTNFGIAHCFPEDFRIHVYLKRWAHECKAIVPPVDIDKFTSIF